MILHDPKVRALHELALFGSCDDRTLRAAARRLDEATVPAGRALARRGEVPGQFVIVLDGQAELRRDGRALATIARGDAYGAALVLAARPSPADLVAVRRTRVLACDARCLQLLLEEVPVLARHLLERSCERVELALV